MHFPTIVLYFFDDGILGHGTLVQILLTTS